MHIRFFVTGFVPVPSGGGTTSDAMHSPPTVRLRIANLDQWTHDDRSHMHDDEYHGENRRMITTRFGGALAAVAALNTAAQIHVFVDDDAPDGGDGLGWASALNDLREAVQLAEDLGSMRGEVRIAGGDYLRDVAGPLEIERPGPFVSGIVLKGGFAGLASPGAPDTRNLSAFVTTLRGLGGGPIVEVNSAVTLADPGGSGGAAHGMLSSIDISRATTFDGLRFVGDQAISVSAEPESAVVVRSCVFEDGWTNGNGGAINARRVSLQVESSRFTGCDAPFGLGGAISHTNGLLAVIDSEFENNSARSGGAIWTDAAALVRTSGFQQNVASFDGGAIFASGADGALDVFASDFQLNSAGDEGGAIDAQRVEIRDALFEFNDASLGGAVRVRASSLIDQSAFEVNAASYGGALYGPASVSDSAFIFNTAENDGGAVYVAASIDRCEFFINQSDSSGGAVAETPIIIDSEFIGNTARLRGGAISNVQQLHRSTVRENSAGFGGGGVRLSGTFELKDSEILDNSLLSDLFRVGSQIAVDNGIGSIDRTVVAGRNASVDGELAVRGGADVLIRDSLVGGQLLVVSSSADLRGCTLVSEPGSSVPAVLGAVSSLVLIESSAIEAQHPLVVEDNTFAVILQSYIAGGADAIEGDPTRFDTLGEILEGDPGFADPLGPDGDWSTWDDNDYSLRARSQLIDIGYGIGVGPGEIRRDDLLGNSRAVGDPGVPGRFIGPAPVDIGAYEFQGTSCLPDMNDDGQLDGSDFTTWIIAYNLQDRFADQNRDGLVSPADFSAWILNFNTGCD